MEYKRLEPIKGKNGYEKTALTMESISEMLAKEGTSMAELAKAREASKANTAAPASGLQQPPHMRSSAPVQDAPKDAAPAPEPCNFYLEKTIPPVRPRSFLENLLRK